jgi:hypothetical protein
MLGGFVNLDAIRSREQWRGKRQRQQPGCQYTEKH